MLRAYKFRLFPNANQTRELETTLETHRRLYNQAFDERQFVYEMTGASLGFVFQCRRFTILRKSNPYYGRITAQSAQRTLRRLDKTFAAFFRRCKIGEKTSYPKFKSRGQFNSWAYTAGRNGGGAKLVDGKLRLQYIGTLRIKQHREMAGTIKIIRLKREASKWFAIFICEMTAISDPSPRPPVGIDVGLESFLTTSEGEQEPNPRYLKSALPELRRVQRAVSRKKLRGSNRQKAISRVQRVHARVRNLRSEHRHKTALKLVRRYGLIAIERLSVPNMLKNGRLSRAISDAGWSGFLNILRCKAESAGVQVVEVDPCGTSQTCTCGAQVQKDLSVRWHDCPECGLSLHRDHVAAKVVLQRALARTAPAGVNVTDCRKRSPRSHVSGVVTSRQLASRHHLGVAKPDSARSELENLTPTGHYHHQRDRSLETQ